MTYGDIYKKAKEIIREENIVDYRPAILDDVNVPNTIMIWLKNGDCIWYRAMEGR